MTGLPDVRISCDGRPLPDLFEVLDLQIHLEINRVPQASITLLDGSLIGEGFPLSDDRLFAPGAIVRIALGYQGGGPAATPVFEGQVTRHAVTANAEGCRLRVELSDKAIQMTRLRRSAVYRNSKDAEVMHRLIQEAGLRVGTIASTPISHPELVQFNASDWDFLVARADVLGLAVRVNRGVVSVEKLALGEATRTLHLGLDDTRDLELELDGAQQCRSLSATGWDRSKLRPSQPVKAKGPALRIGAQNDQELAEALESPRATLIHAVPTAPRELQSWADARLAKSRWSLLRGSGWVDGDARLKPLDTVQIQGVGARFDGKALVSGVTHSFNSDGWTTRLILGLSAENFARTPDLLDMPAAGLLPAATGLQIATVQSLENDPAGELRVRVSLPHLADSAQELLWARPLSPDAGAKRGFVFRPEVGDEVVIGFLNDDPRHPVILGALFGSKNKPPKPVQSPDQKNNLRAIVSRAGTRIVFDDDIPALRLETTASGSADGDSKNRIIINEKEKTITIEDQHNNTILLSDAGIRLNTEKDIALTAEGSVTIKGKNGIQIEGNKASLKGQKLELEGQSQVSVKGAQVELTANTVLNLKGGAQTSLTSDGMLEVKGALVKIN
ncbi:MAG: type VI secretion system tip protein VgrG [Synechococcaceae cyanobacterium]|nr:type VI secretion system tip protein VgrG [Synechococcaceae cyanobacterium]